MQSRSALETDSVRSALVTGITGQDGGYLAEQLIGEGVTVHGLLRPGELAPAHVRALGDALRLHSVDLGSDEELHRVLRKARPHEVYNLAGVSSVALSWKQPALTADINGTFVARLLQAVLSEQERRGEQVVLVQASTAEVFAGSAERPQDEATAFAPRSPYGASKAFAHHMVQIFRDQGLQASNAVFYNHESPRRPKSFVTRKITSTVAAIAEGREQFLVLGNLDARRDWGWAPEYVDAMVRLARFGTGEDIVVATGVAHSVAEFVAVAFDRVGISDWQSRVRVDDQLSRPMDSVELVGNPDRARRLLGWEALTSFEQLVGRMVEADLRETC